MLLHVDTTARNAPAEPEVLAAVEKIADAADSTAEGCWAVRGGERWGKDAATSVERPRRTCPAGFRHSHVRAASTAAPCIFPSLTLPRKGGAKSVNFGLTPEQEMVVSTVRGFVETELYPLEAEVERSDNVPREIAPRRSATR